MFPLIFLLVVVSLITVRSAEEVSVSGHDKVVICYWGTWANYRPKQGKFVADNVDGNLCTHLIYSFAGLDTNNWNIKTLDAWLDLEENYGLKGFKKATDLRLKYPHLKVMIAIGGWNEGSKKYSEMAADDTKRANFVNSTVDFLKKYSFDGLDLDWEYPGKRGGSASDKRNFIKLVKELREAFEEDKFLLTAAIGAAKGTIDISYDVAAMYKYLDFVNVMCYDYHGKWDKKTGHNAPLKPRPDETGDDKVFNLEYTIKYLIEKGAKPEKTVLGVPLYGRAFLLSNQKNNRIGAPASDNSFAGPFTREAGFLGYNEICDELQKNNASWEVVWENCHKAPYMVNKVKWVSYDNERSVKLKADFAFDMKLGGVMVWSIETDDFHGNCKKEKYPLLRALNVALTEKSSGTREEDDGGSCDAADYSTTARSVVTRRPWVPTPLPPQDSQTSSSGGAGAAEGAGGVCVKPNEPNPDPSDCAKFYLCANGVPHAMACRGGTLYSPSLMTCDHAVNVNCNARKPTETDSNSNSNSNSNTGVWQGDIDNSIGDESFEPTFQVTETQSGPSMSSEKIAIIVLVFILLAVCLAISFCFRERIKEVAGPYLDQFSPDRLKISTPSTLGLLKPHSFTKYGWPSATNKAAQMRYNVTPISSPGYNVSSLPTPGYNSAPTPASITVRGLPPVPTVPVPPPRRKRSVVEIQTGLAQESENTQSIA